MSQNAMEGSLSLRDLTKLLEKLSFTIEATLPVKLQICFLHQIQIKTLRKNLTYEPTNYSEPTGQRGAVMVNNQPANLQWKISVNSTPRSNHTFRCIKEGLGCFVSRDYHKGSMVCSGKSLAHKCSRIRSSEASNSLFYKIQETKINSSTDKQHDSYLSLSLLFIKHGRNPEQTFNRNLERTLRLSSQRGKYI